MNFEAPFTLIVASSIDFGIWAELGWQAWLTLGIIGVIFATLIATDASTDVVLLGAIAILTVAGVLVPKEALAGFSNEGIITIAVLYVVVAGLEATGGNTIIT
jgi:hypothetical protein